MSAYQLKLAKYYRLANKAAVETENVAVLVDTKNRRLSVSCNRVQTENIEIVSEPGRFPRMMFREMHLYVLFSTSSSDGFRLTFERKERDRFLKIMHSMGILSDIPAEMSQDNSHFSQESQRSSSSSNVDSQLCSQQYRPSPAASPSHRQPSFTQQATPQVTFPPNVHRNSTHLMHHQNSSYSSPSSQQFNRSPYHGISYETTGGTCSMSSPSSHYQNDSRGFSNSGGSSGGVRRHDYGESVEPSRKKWKQGIKKESKAIQTDENLLIDMLLENDEFTKKAVEAFIKNDQFVDVVKSMRSRLEKMDTVERNRFHWRTNPNYSSQGMPPPVIRLPTSETEN